MFLKPSVFLVSIGQISVFFFWNHTLSNRDESQDFVHISVVHPSIQVNSLKENMYFFHGFSFEKKNKGGIWWFGSFNCFCFFLSTENSKSRGFLYQEDCGRCCHIGCVSLSQAHHRTIVGLQIQRVSLAKVLDDEKSQIWCFSLLVETEQMMKDK